MSKKQDDKQPSTKSVPLSSLIPVKDMTLDMCRDVILLRIQRNMQETKHPFHI
jgi:hypothetical protein